MHTTSMVAAFILQRTKKLINQDLESMFVKSIDM